MLAKAICVAVSGLSLALAITPPPSARTVSKSKDKINVEGGVVGSKSGPYVFVGSALVQTSVYLLIMSLGRLEHNRNNVAIQRMEVLESWHIVAALIAISGMLLRWWSYKALKNFFTYQLTIRPKHKLVSDGPYRLLLHPSYTGAILNGFGVYTVLWNKGLWDAATWYLGRFADYHPHQYQYASWMGMLVPILYGGFQAQMFLRRHRGEEAMLRGHFGEEWDEYASKRWRFIPYVY